MSVARVTNEGTPVLYLPFKHRHDDDIGANIRETPAEIFFSKIYVVYDIGSEKKISTNNGTIKMGIYFFDKICSQLNLYDIISSFNTYHNAFTFYFLLDYAQYKLDVPLINVLLEKLSHSHILDITMIMKVIYRLYLKKIYIKLPELYSERILYDYIHNEVVVKFFMDNTIFEKKIYEGFDDLEMQNFLIKCTDTITYSSISCIIFYDRIDLLIKLYDKMKECNLLSYAIRYESKNIIDYLYSIEKPIKDFIDNNFLNDVKIDYNDVKIIDSIIDDGNLELLKLFYEHTIDIKKLNKRIILFLAVRKNNYIITEFLLSKGVKPDYNSCVYASYNGFIDILKLLISYDAVINDSITYYAAFSGKIEILKYFHKRNYKFNYDIIDFLIKGNHLNINNIESLKNIVEPLQDHILNYVCKDKNVEIDIIEYLIKII
jgi:hypothetical protein